MVKGVYIILVKIAEWWGVIFVSRKWLFQGGVGLFEIPSMVGV